MSFNGSTPSTSTTTSTPSTSSSKPFAKTPTFPLTPIELERWIRFSLKGGVGKARAKVDRVSQDGGDRELMMLQGDDIVVLMDLGNDIYLGHCEGVVGLFHGQDVEFLQAKLKKPVMTSRRKPSTTSTASPSNLPLPPPSSSSTSTPLVDTRRTNTVQKETKEGTPRIVSALEESTPTRKEKEVGRQERGGGEVEGMEGLGFRVDQRNENHRTECENEDLRRKHEENSEDNVVSIRSPDLAGAFHPSSSMSHSPSTVFDRSPSTESPSASSLSRTPSLVTSPQSSSEDARHSFSTSSTPTTPYSASIHNNQWESTGGDIYESVPNSEEDFESLRITDDRMLYPSRGIEKPRPPLEHHELKSQFSLDSFSTSYSSSSNNFPTRPPLVSAFSSRSKLSYDSTTASEFERNNGRSAFSTSPPSPTLDSFSSSFQQQPPHHHQQQHYNNLPPLRTPKSSTSTIDSSASTTSNRNGGGGGGNLSIPSTPGEDATLGFIFDSYRYSRTVTPSVSFNNGSSSSGGGDGSNQPSPTKSLMMAGRGEREVEEGLERSNGGEKSYGAATELRFQHQNRIVASALPLHISPTRSRHIINPSTSSSTSSSIEFDDSRRIPRESFDSDINATPARSTTSNNYVEETPRATIASAEDLDTDLAASRRLFETFFSPPQLDTDSTSALVSGLPESSTPSTPRGDSPERTRSMGRLRRKSSSAGVKGLQISAPTVPIPPSSAWRSTNGNSPITQTMQDQGRDPNDVFISSTVSQYRRGDPSSVPPSPSQRSSPTEESHDHSSTGHHGPHSRSSCDQDQYVARPPPQFGPSSHFTHSPSSASFYSTVSTDEHSSAVNHSTPDLSESTASAPRHFANKLRKKPSLRLRPSQSRLAQSESQSSLNLASLPPPPPPHASTSKRTISDPFKVEPASPPASPARNLNRKPSTSRFGRKSAEKDREKKLDYSAGISSKDFEEETVKIGSSAFEIVKPLAALLKDEDEVEDVPTIERTESSPYLDTPSTPLRPSPSSFGTSFSQYPSFGQSTVSLAAQSSHFSPPTPLSAEGSGRSIEDHRAKELKWVQTLSSGMTAAQVRKSKKMKTLVQSGVPSSVRGKVWAFLAEADREKQPGLYQQLCAMGEGPHGAAIDQDCSMMLLDHPQFADRSAGREDLDSVLHAFSHYDRQLGYYPGLVNIVALLLMQMPAEDSFYTLVSLVDNYGFKQFFAVGREELRLELIAFSFLLEMVEPKVARRFNELDIKTAEFLPPWLSTFFLAVLPLPTVLRIVDMFLFDPKTRYRAPLALLDLSHYTDENVFPSRDSVLNYLLAPPPTAFSPVILCPAIANVKITDDKLKKAIKQGAKTMLAPRR